MKLIYDVTHNLLIAQEGGRQPITQIESPVGEGESIQLILVDDAGYTRTGLEKFTFVVKPKKGWDKDAHALATDFVWVPALGRWQARVNYNTTLLSALLKRGVSAPEKENDFIDLEAQFAFKTTSTASAWRSQIVSFRLHNALWRGDETNPSTGTPIEVASQLAFVPSVIAIDADQSNAAKAGSSTAMTLQEITELAFGVQAGVLYGLRVVIPYNASSTSVGARFVLTGPSLTFMVANQRSTLDAGSVRIIEGITAFNQPSAAGATSLATGNLCIMEATFKPSADGTVGVSFASETNSGTITIKAGARLEKTQLTA